jgi:hypothetical protein
MPFVVGTVLEVGEKQKMIAVSSSFGGDEQMIRVSDTTKIVTQKEAKVAELKPGDQVQVQGMPSGITANSLTIGEAPDFMRMFVPGGRGGGGARGQGGPGQPPPAFASASGKVKAVSPLTVAVNDTVTVVIKVAPDARVQKITPIALGAIKENDRIMAAGQQDNEGVLNATLVAVNFGGGMFGGFGGPRPGGAPGPGGPPAGGPRP